MVANTQVNQEDPDSYVDDMDTPYVDHIDTHKGSFHEGKHLKFPIMSLYLSSPFAFSLFSF